jgi:hypothetical protein
VRRDRRALPAGGTVTGVAGLAAAVALTVASCSGTPPAVPLQPPAANAAAAATCGRLHAALPSTVAGRYRRRPVTPASASTAAWGDPPIALRCGVAPPPRPLVGDELVVDGVRWLAGQQGDVVSWRSLGRSVTVELDVPAGYDDQDAVLADVSPAVARTVPAR